MKFTKYINYKAILFIISLFGLFSCQNEALKDADYSFKTAIDVTQDKENFEEIEFKDLDHLDLGFYKGNVWIKLDITNNDSPGSFMVIGNDLINRNYRFYMLDTIHKRLEIITHFKDLEKYDHRTFNNSKPNFRIDLAPNQSSTFFISTSSDGRILQATPKLLSLEDYTRINNQSIIFDSIFFGVIAILLIINIFHWNLLKNKIYYSYGIYIISSCLMYLFVEGRLYGLGLNHFTIDHLMFLSIRLWILSSILFSMKFLDVKKANPKLYRFIKLALIFSLGGTTVYQLIFFKSSISNLHMFENLIGFIWIILSAIILILSYKRKKQEAKYYLIAFSFFILFVGLGLIDSHFTILPGDPFTYFKIGTIFEFIGFTYFISRLIKMKLTSTTKLETELIQNKKDLQQLSEQLEAKFSEETNTIEKTHLVGVLKLVEKAISNDAEWDDFKMKFENLNPKFLETLIKKHPNLSKSEIRLLILIKLNYSQKEMANILGIEPNSVKKAKNRVRKKLNISDTIVLNDYINHF